MADIELTFISVGNLAEKELWDSFLSGIQECLYTKFSHLDTNDPVRKKIVNINSAVDFICAFGEHEDSRRLFGKFGRSEIELEIELFRGESSFPNSVSFYFPKKILESEIGIKAILDIFGLGNKYLKPFYSYGDSIDKITGKKKSTGMSVDFEAELVGVFWVTYFNKDYVNYFGKNKFDELPCIQNEELSGITIKLGKSPVSNELELSREEAESLLGKDSFVDPSLAMDKPIGKNALIFSQIKG